MTVATELIPVAEAQRRLFQLIASRTTGEELIPLSESLGRVLARPVSTLWAIPGCDNSAMDGYAVLAADCSGASPTRPVRLAASGEARTGAPIAALELGTALAIATGGPIPRGADAVVPIEDTQPGDRGTVLVLQAPRPGDHVRRAGGDAPPGTVMVPAGRRLRPVDIAACAAAGAASVRVHRRPVVALMSGGDELIPVGSVPAPHQVVNSNAPMLAAAVAEAGGEVVDLGIAADSREAVRERLAAAAGCDLVLTSAGVSVGRHDHVREVVAELGGIDAWRLAMRPGKPLLIGRVGDLPLIGLPGNPASAAVTFELFGRPALLSLQGASDPRRHRIAVRLGELVEAPRSLETYLRIRLSDAPDGIPVASLSGGQTSSMLRSLTDAEGLLVVPAGVARVEAGQLLTALDLR
ncbi:MAG TPA: gephyrin-like molybdotransferase Glp [Candidatus Binatia bacterium]|nr:gephyrin-like molybdotransferase Glp [Candidatus Binatia bacterium]